MNDIVRSGTPNHLLSIYDKIRFPEKKNITTFILASLIIIDGKIDKNMLEKTLITHKQRIRSEGIRDEDIFRYARWMISL